MSFQKHKTDPTLGREIEKHLREKGVNTPTVTSSDTESPFVPNAKDVIENAFGYIMTALGLDLSDDSLSDTPNRVAKMFTQELFWGLDPANFPKCTTIENKMNYDEMIVERNITSMSACEHHFVTIDGIAHVAYFPHKKVLGLSKMNRIVEYFSRRPQVQERLTEQIYHALSYILDTEDVAVVVEGQHYCVKARGVEDSNSKTVTSRLGGRFRIPEVRLEFFSMIRGN